MKRHILTSVIALALPLGTLSAQQKQAGMTQQSQPVMMMTEVDTRAVKWNDIEVPGFPSGVKIAALAGSPEKAGEVYTLRLKFPDGYIYPVHYHPMAENLTVISGTFYLAMGDKAVEGTEKRYIAGDFLNVPGKMSHFGRVAGETVVQLHGVGPFQILLGSPATK